METRASDRFNSLMNDDPAKLSLSNFLAGESDDPLQAPASFTNWMRLGAWAVQLYEPELLASADARTVINYGGKPRPVINLCSYNYLGLANHPEVLAAAHEALRTHGMGACGSPMLSGMTDLHRELERRVAKFLKREDAMLFNSGFGGALGTISGLLRKTDVALLDNRSHLSLRDGAVLSRCRTEKFEHNDPASLDAALSRHKGRRQLVIAAILKALELGTSQPELRAQLWENADYFHAQLRSLGLDTGESTTYVMPIVIADRERMYRLGHELRRRGLWVAPVDYPAVTQSRICFRACVTAMHTRADLDEALNILADTLFPALLQKQSA